MYSRYHIHTHFGSTKVQGPSELDELAMENPRIFKQMYLQCTMNVNGYYPSVIKHGLLENGPFIGGVPFKTSIYHWNPPPVTGFSIAMSDY